MNKEKHKRSLLLGLKSGLPVCLGYIPISFAFGMLAVQSGMPWWIPLVISMTNLTSAGQVAGLSLIVSGGAYLEIAVTTFIINIRYMLMSLALCQKIDDKMTLLQRLIVGFGITDEIFAVAVRHDGTLNTPYMLGLIASPYIGWTFGTILGATATSLLPFSVQNALSITIYGMFLAIIVPPARAARPVLIVCLISAGISCIFKWVPFLSQVSAGWVIIITAIIAAGFCASRFPVHTGKDTRNTQVSAETL